VLFIDPLGISVVPNSNRDAVAGGAIGGIQPIRKALFDALLQQSCKNASYITIFDLVVGSVTGAGEFAVNLGGAQASSSAIGANQFQLGNGSFALGGSTVDSNSSLSSSTLGSSTDSGGGGSSSFAGTAGDPGTSGSDSGDAAPAGGSGGGNGGGIRNAVPAAATFKGTRGGALAGVGLGSLLLLGLMAEGDRRKMRRAQREIPNLQE
jgi:hypothetical protein